MLNITSLLLLFALASITGWIIEVIYRSSFKKLVNPGFLSGPYLPIYGSSTIILYLISSLEMNIIARLILFVLITTLVELLVGLFFIKYYNLKLWDYSNDFLNYKGIISLKYSIFWLVLSTIFYFFVYPFLSSFLNSLNNNTIIFFALGIFYGIFIMDVIKSFNMAHKIKIIVSKHNILKSKRISLDYLKFKNQLDAYLKTAKHTNFFKRYFFNINNLGEEFSQKVNQFLKNRNKKQ